MVMKTFIVGGAVRDMIMGITPKDIDYLVVGTTIDDMLAAGFIKVGADFPVFLHPDTKDEYALARRERKTSSGYLGFETESGVDVTLEEDLSRRDLTINSIAYEASGFACYIDPFNGQGDLEAKILRHTSKAFAEDPVRVLRLARFRARLGPEWTVAPETAELIATMAKSGVLNELNSERIWNEMKKALMEPYARLFFDTLLEVDALHVIFPEVYQLKTALEAIRWHPEGNAYEHTMLVLTQAVNFGYDLETRFAALTHDFGKALTPKDQLPAHYKHEVTGVAVVKSFAERLTVPSKIRESAMKTTRYHMYMHKLDEISNKSLLKMITAINGLNNLQTVKLLIRVAECDERGRLGKETADVGHLQQLVTIAEALQQVKFADVFPNNEKPKPSVIINGMTHARYAAMKRVRK